MSITPTAESVFGPTPWILDAGGTGPNGITYKYNPSYFATPTTANIVAQMLGGVVEEAYAITGKGGPFVQTYPNQMIRMPNGVLLNAGLIANIWNHGYPISYIETLVSNELSSGDPSNPIVWTYPIAAPTPTTFIPTVGLMIANIGDNAMQADGTVWKRIS
jgi:hypothetical protein